MTNERAALRPILIETARIVRTRSPAGALPQDVESMVDGHAPLLLRALEASPGLRERVRAALSVARPSSAATDLATLLLHPDSELVRVGLRLAAAPRSDPRAIKHLERAKTDLQTRLRSANGRLEHARRDTEQAQRRAAEATTAAEDAGERAQTLQDRLTILQGRFNDPRALAAALLRTLPPAAPTTTPNGKGGQDPAGAMVAALRAIAEPPAVPMPTVTELDLRVTPLGGDDHIGGSCVLVEAAGTRLLVDAGLRPGDTPLPPRDVSQALAGPLHAVVVTHAHTDHAGYVPALVRAVPGLRIIATPETAQLMPVMWADSVKIMNERAAGLRRWGTDWRPLYGREDIESAARACTDTPFGAPLEIGRLKVELFPAGHILGAAGVVVGAGDKRVVVSGDVSGFRQESVAGCQIPEIAKAADLLMLESTCCTETHRDRDAGVAELVRAIEETWSGGGRALIPAFALGRAQELALIMHRFLPHVPVRIDGMAAEVSALFESVSCAAERPLTIFAGAVARAGRPDDLDAFRRGVIITTSGMLTGGPAIQWARRVLPEPQSALFITGYQDEESAGRRLLDLADRPGGDFVLSDRGVETSIPVRARVQTMRLSAHADRRGLLDIVDEVAPGEVMLVHGLPARQREFAEVLKVRHHRPVATTVWH